MTTSTRFVVILRMSMALALTVCALWPIIPVWPPQTSAQVSIFTNPSHQSRPAPAGGLADDDFDASVAISSVAIGGGMAEVEANLGVANQCPFINITPGGLPNGTVGASYFQTLTAIGGAPPFTFDVATGNFPPGLTLTSLGGATRQGTISGIPTQAGTFTFNIRATDASGCPGILNYTLTVLCPIINLTPTSLPNGTVGASYFQTLTASAGTTPVTFDVASGNFPPGLTLMSLGGDTRQGTISGAPTKAGTFNFNIRARDAFGCTGILNYTLTILCPIINLTPTSLPNGTVGVAYFQTLTASAGTTPVIFSVSSGNFPPGLTLMSLGGDTRQGTISGAPTEAGTFTFTVTASDALDSRCTDRQVYTIEIGGCDEITVNPTNPILPTAPIGRPYTQIFTASGGAPPHNFSIADGALPPGLVLDSGGNLSGVPIVSGVFKFTVKATDANGCTGSRIYTILDCPVLTIIPPTLPNGTVGVAYNQTLTVLGGIAPFTFAVTTGALPPGLTLSANGVISGTPTTTGTFNFTVAATDSDGNQGIKDYSIEVTAPPPPQITINPATLPGGTIGAAYNQTLTASGGTAPFTFAVTSGALPPGLTLSADGVISGTPTTAGTFNFIVTATDINGNQGVRAYTIVVAESPPPPPPPPPITINPPTLPNGTVGIAYNQTLTASGGTAPFTFAVISGALPPGLTLSADGVINGAPTATGTFNFIVTATDNNGRLGAQVYTIIVTESPPPPPPPPPSPITINPEALPPGAYNQPYSQMVTASGGVAPFEFAITSGSLPPGLSLSPTGVISGTPTDPGAFNFTVTATDANLQVGSRDYTIVITPPPPCPPISPVIVSDNDDSANTARNAGLAVVLGGLGVIIGREVARDPTITINPTNSNLPPGSVGQTYTQTFTASGGSPSYSFTIQGSPPPGLPLTSTGTLSGSPTVAGSFSFSVMATDANNRTGAVSYTLVINPPSTASASDPDALLVSINPDTLPEGTSGLAYNQALSASGGVRPFSFSITTGSLPPGLTLTASGSISGVPTALGTSYFTAIVTDRSGRTGTRDYAITVNPPCSSLTLTPAKLPNAEIGQTYNQTLMLGSGNGPFTFSLLSGALPVGLLLDLTNGSISGKPSRASTSDFTVRAIDSRGCSGAIAFSLRIAPGKFTTVSAASHTPLVAPKEIVVGFGVGLADTTVSASSPPLPASLGGLRVTVKDKAGIERAALLLMISPTMISYQIPERAAPGTVTVSVFRGTELVAAGTARIAEPSAPSSPKTKAARRRRRTP